MSERDPELSATRKRFGTFAVSYVEPEKLFLLSFTVLFNETQKGEIEEEAKDVDRA